MFIVVTIAVFVLIPGLQGLAALEVRGTPKLQLSFFLTGARVEE